MALGLGTRRLRDRNPQSATPASAPPTESFGFAAALWRTRRYLLPELRHFLIFAALSGVAMLLQLAASLVGFDLLTNKVFLGEPLTALQARLLGLDAAEFVTVQELGQDARLTLRTAFLLLTGVLLALGFALGNGLGYYLTWILQRVNQHLRLAMMDSAVHLSLRRSDSRQVGDAIYRVYQDSAMVTGVVRNALVAPAVAFFNLLVAVGAVSFFSLYLGMLFLVAAAPALLLAWVFTPRLRTLSSKARAANSELTSHIQESVGGVRLLKACRAELGALEGFRSRSTTALDRAYELRRSRCSPGPAGLHLRRAGSPRRGLPDGALGVGGSADVRLWLGGLHRLRRVESGRFSGGPGTLERHLRHWRLASCHLVRSARHERGAETRVLSTRRRTGSGG